VKSDDVIVEVNGEPVADARRFEELVRAAKPGSDLRLFVRRFKGRDTRFLAVVPVP
jgi:S1-C subfamily serine protease